MSADYVIEDEDFGARRDRTQAELLERILERLESRHLTREKMYRRLLTKPKGTFNLQGTIDRIDVIDAVRENVKTSLTFGNYRRAAWYLKMLERLCKKYL